MISHLFNRLWQNETGWIFKVLWQSVYSGKGNLDTKTGIIKVHILEKNMPKRKRLSDSQKAQIVLEAIREEKSVAQIVAENSIHPNQIHKWKKQALEDFAQLFEDDRKGERAREAEHEKQVNELYAELGRLSAQLSWLKKKSGLKLE